MTVVGEPSLKQMMDRGISFLFQKVESLLRQTAGWRKTSLWHKFKCKNTDFLPGTSCFGDSFGWFLSIGVVSSNTEFIILSGNTIQLPQGMPCPKGEGKIPIYHCDIHPLGYSLPIKSEALFWPPVFRLRILFTGSYSLCKCIPNSAWFNQHNFLFPYGLAFLSVSQEHFSCSESREGSLVSQQTFHHPAVHGVFFPTPLPAAPPLKVHFNSVNFARSLDTSYGHLTAPVNTGFL